MPSFVTHSDKNYAYSEYRIFDVWNYSSIPEVTVKQGENGMFIVDAPEGANIHEFIDFISGIFHPDSNFTLYLSHAFNVPMETFKGIISDFNGVEITATKGNCNPQKMFDKWNAEQVRIMKENKKRWW